MRQAADRLATGVSTMGSALKTPFASTTTQSAGYRGGSGYGSAAVRALRAAPGAIAKPLSEGIQKLPQIAANYLIMGTLRHARPECESPAARCERHPY